MNIAEWIKSKKTKDMLTTQVIIAVVVIAVVAIAKGDAERVQGLMDAIDKGLYMIGGLGGVKIVGQAAVDVKKETVKAAEKPPAN